MGKHPGTSSSSLFVPLFCFLVSSVVGQQQGSLHVVAAAQEGAPVPVPVRVGVILNWASPVSRRRRTGIEMAVEDYYAAHPGSPAKVELHFRDSSGDVVGAASAAVDLIKNAQVQAIIGPQTSSEAEFVAHLGSRAHVPVLSYSATSPSLSPSQTPFFIRTAANDSLQALPLAAFLAAFGWRAVAVVHEDSPYGAGILPALADALVSASGGSGSAAAITHRAALPVDAGNDRLDAVLRALASAPTRVVIVHARYALAARLFARAWEAGMVSEGYVWVATDGVGSFVDSLSQEDLEAMQGVVSVRPQVKRTREVRNFAARFRARFRHDNPDLDDEHVVHDESTVMRLWSYDTAWAIAAAADEAVGSSAFQPTPPQPDLDWVGVSATGARLLKALVDTRFDGMAGKFKLVDGQLQVAAYEVVNVVGRGTRTVGLWMPPESSSGSKLLKLKHILWPGDTLSTPKGWTPASHNGMPVLRVAVPVKRGFKQFVGVDPKNSSRITGYCIDVFDEVMRSLAYPVAYRYVPFPDSSDSYDKLVDLVRREEADVVVGDVTITASRMDNGVDYTMPFTESGWAMVVAVREDAGSACMWVFLQPLTTSLWLASFAFFCFTGFVVWVLEHRVNDKFRGTPTQQFGLIFYFAFSTLVFSHKEKLVNNLSRLVVIVWVFVVLILTSSYTASLTSMLTVQKLQPMVTDVRELQRRGHYIGYQEGTFIEPLLKKMGFDERRMKKYSTEGQYAEALSRGSANGGVAAVFDEIPYLKLFLSQYCDGYMMVGPVYKTDGFGFVFPRASPMVADVSREILRLAEGDKMARIEKAWFGEPEDGACRGSSSSAAAVGSSSSSNLSFESFGGLFLITGLVSSLTLLLYLATFAYRERGEVRVVEAQAEAAGHFGYRSALIRRMCAWLQHYDRKEKDLKSRTFKTSNDESLRNGSEFAGQTPRRIAEGSRNGRGDVSQMPMAGEEENAMGRGSPVSSHMNTGSSPVGTTEWVIGESSEQRMAGAAASEITAS